MIITFLGKIDEVRVLNQDLLGFFDSMEDNTVYQISEESEKDEEPISYRFVHKLAIAGRIEQTFVFEKNGDEWLNTATFDIVGGCIRYRYNDVPYVLTLDFDNDAKQTAERLPEKPKALLLKIVGFVISWINNGRFSFSDLEDHAGSNDEPSDFIDFDEGDSFELSDEDLNDNVDQK